MFNEKERILANEASLTASLLGNGLNTLRKATLDNFGIFYQAFFSLSIGIERLLKIILITKYRCDNNGEFADDIPLKNFGHDLLKLAQAGEINFKEDSIHYKILTFLNDFSNKARYFNLDTLINKNNISVEDPLVSWNKIEKEILKNVEIKKKIANKRVLANYLNMVFDIKKYDLEGNYINDAQFFLDEIETRDIIQGYETEYVYEIIRKMVNKISELQNKMYLMPILTEFFMVYLASYRNFEIRKKKNFLVVD